MIFIEVHELHGQMHPSKGLATILLAHDPLSSLAYPMITHTPLVAGNFLIKTSVARQRPTNNTHTHNFSDWKLFTLHVSMYWPFFSALYMYVPADILDRVAPKLHELGLDYECVGGGRIRHDSKDKKIHIYGYSVVSPMLLMNISFIVSRWHWHW